jgi:hypothetical protein
MRWAGQQLGGQAGTRIVHACAAVRDMAPGRRGGEQPEMRMKDEG